MSQEINIEIVGGANSNLPRETFINESREKFQEFTDEQLGAYYDANMQALQQHITNSNGNTPQNLDLGLIQTAIDLINAFGLQLIKNTVPEITYRQDVATLLQSNLAGAQLDLAKGFNDTLNKFGAGIGIASIVQSWLGGDVSGGAERSFSLLVGYFAGSATEQLLMGGLIGAGAIAGLTGGLAVGIGVGFLLDNSGFNDKFIQLLNQFGGNLGGDVYDLLHGGGGIGKDIILKGGMSVYDPLIVDLDGDGIETVGLDSKVLFDHAADGTKNATGWVGKDDGLLVRDINNNGAIDSGRELFGDNTILSSGQQAKTAYEALADLDSNKDGLINDNDSGYAQLKIWQDANQDGISQATELKTLAEAGITSLNVAPTSNTSTSFTNGNAQTAAGTYTKSDGTTGISGAVNFVGDEFIREFTTKIDTSAVADLPDMHASGSVRDLREAAALSADLATKLKTYADSTSKTTTDLDSLVKSWANTSSMQTLASTLKPGAHPSGGRGTNLTQEEIYKLGVIEKFTGYYGGMANFKDPAADLPNGRYSGTWLGIQLDAASINKNYDLLLKSVATSISVQTDLKDSMNEVLFKFSNNGVTLDFSNLYAKVNGDNPTKAVSDVIEMYRYFKDGSPEVFGAAAQQEVFAWIKERIVVDGIEPDNKVQFGNSTSGDDLIIVANNSIAVNAGAGNDQIIGLKSDDKLYGGDGNDIVDAGAGTDYIAGGWGDDVISGGDGNDTIYGEQGSNTLKGGAGDDIIYGGSNAASDYWNGYAPYGQYEGSNILEGGTGNDTLRGGWKADTYIFNKGDGKDIIIEQRKDTDWGSTKYGYTDVLQFGEGITKTDLSYQHVANDLVITVGAEGADSITIKDWYANYDNRLEQFKFADGSLMLSADIMALDIGYTGTENNETVLGWDGKDMLNAAGGDDKIYSYGGNDTIDAGSGNNYVEAGSGNDVINSGSGDDKLYGGDGNDIVDAGAGTDYIAGGWGDDVISGGDGNDTIYGEQGSNTLKGGAGDDIIYGGSNAASDYWNGYAPYGQYEGSNILEGGTGNDTLRGGWKADTYIFNKGDGKDIIIEQRKDTDWGSTKYGYTDVLQFGEGITKTDLSYQHVANDLVITVGAEGADSITIKDWYANYDNQIETFKFADGSQVGIANLRVGLDSNETITGTDLADLIYGNGGNDTLNGNAGNDVIIGDKGDDILNGGAGDDTYVMSAGDGKDIIDDSQGRTTVVFDKSVNKEDLWFTQKDEDLVITNTQTQDVVTVKKAYAWLTGDDPYAVIRSDAEVMESIMSGKELLKIAHDMARLGATPMAQSEMTASQQAEFSNIINSNWMVDASK